MSKAEILAELPRLAPEELREIRLRLAELEGDDWMDDGELTQAEKTLIQQRVADFEKNPEASIPWSEAKARLKARYGE